MGNEREQKRFLIVEDEFMIAILLEDYLEDLGYGVACQADTVADALKLIEADADIDGAILDMNIGGEMVDPIADALTARGIPFCFMTGYGAGAARRHPHAPVISKPFDIVTLQATLATLMSVADRDRS